MELTQEQLKEKVDYNPETGVFTRKVSSGGVKIGTVAGYLNNNGYRYLQVNYGLYLEHRLAWLYVHGSFPQHEIDHINRIRHDNRLENLRAATSSQNKLNRVARPNKCGLAGVYALRNKGFAAQLTAGGKRMYLGCFKTAEEAHQAFLAAKAIHHPFAYT